MIWSSWQSSIRPFDSTFATATADNFLGSPVYAQARAFLQRPAADALLRALRRLQPLGYGLLVHDGYRPCMLRKFSGMRLRTAEKYFVADPAQGSRHNRGCAVDLTLYDLKTNEPVEMTGLFDEMSPRSFPDYSGGTSLQRLASRLAPLGHGSRRVHRFRSGVVALRLQGLARIRHQQHPIRKTRRLKKLKFTI